MALVLTQNTYSYVCYTGGIVDVNDLSQYKIKWRKPVMVTLKDGSQMHSLPPPSSGAVLTYIMNIMDGKMTGYEVFLIIFEN